MKTPKIHTSQTPQKTPKQKNDWKKNDCHEVVLCYRELFHHYPLPTFGRKWCKYDKPAAMSEPQKLKTSFWARCVLISMEFPDIHRYTTIWIWYVYTYIYSTYIYILCTVYKYILKSYILASIISHLQLNRPVFWIGKGLHLEGSTPK